MNCEILLFLALDGPSALCTVSDKVDRIRGKRSAVLIANETCAVVILEAAIFGCEAEDPRVDCVNASVLLLLIRREREGMRLMQFVGMIIIGYFRG